jgi:hypothetical protein
MPLYAHGGCVVVVNSSRFYGATPSTTFRDRQFPFSKIKEIEKCRKKHLPTVRKCVDNRHSRKHKLSKYVLAKVREMKSASHATVFDMDSAPKADAEWRMYAMSLRPFCFTISNYKLTSTLVVVQQPILYI